MSAVLELDSVLQRLEAFGVRLGLETTRRLLKALGDPQKDLRPVLVAGTNGKGSTAALLASMVRAGGYRTGLYTSPHLESVEERLRIDGQAISNQSLTSTMTEVVAAAENRLGYLPTYFEALTASAFLWFARESVDLAVFEVGLGGRLDATNGCEPELSLITEIGLEHQRYLGKTLASIGREKAGILRAQRPAIAWVERQEARQAIQEVADQVAAQLTWGAAESSIESCEELGWQGQRVGLQTSTGIHDLFLPLLGRHQLANLALATLAAEELARRGMGGLDNEAIAKGVATTRWPGRLEWVHPPDNAKPVLLDVAHNPDGAEMLRRSLDGIQGRRILLFGALADKEVDRVLPGLAKKASKVVLTSPASPRAMDLAALAAMVPADDKIILEADRSAALTAALEAPGDFVVVCGSVYLVGDVRMELRRRFGTPYPAVDNLHAE